MSKYAGTKTEKNLEAAFAGESQARNKYTYFASVAKKEGYEQISALFLKTADNEKEHAKLWFKALNGGEMPDVMTCAKALGCGVPVGAFVLGKKVAETSLAPGDHGTTYGGNPFVCAAVSKVFDLYEKEQIVDHVQKVGAYLEEKLNALVDKYDFLKRNAEEKV